MVNNTLMFMCMTLLLLVLGRPGTLLMLYGWEALLVEGVMVESYTHAPHCAHAPSLPLPRPG